MPLIRIEGVPPWDGEYPINIDALTNRDLHLIKRVSGVRAGELGEEFDRGNNDLIVAITLIAAQRNGVAIPEDDLWDASIGKITLVGDEVEEDLPSAPPSVNGGHDSTSGGPTTSGEGSETTGAGNQETTPLFTGSRGSATTAESG